MSQLLEIPVKKDPTDGGEAEQKSSDEAVVLSVEIAQEYIALNPTKETEKQLNALRRKFRGFYARAQKVAKSILEKWTALDWKTKQLATSLYYFVRLSDTPIWNIAGSLVSHFKLWLEENKKDIDLLLPKFSSLMNEYRVGESDILEE
ncbi:hypothetical protein QR680_014001 [Steinernema hermaphroditum]|uniref:Uncharacterized protein n=1 Tax=Steinernema hermaphroditum TaxID=289476 RepID=A0AA39I9P1_9BILA|nr:hypothetical protein QR680_014001 [Steinernema hermaphroditum]